jgi:hypothetical protein
MTPVLLPYINRVLLACCIACVVTVDLTAQDRTLSDTVFFLANKKGLLGKIGRSLSVNDSNLPVQDSAQKNENAYLPYAGRVIRYVFIQKIGFEKNVNDTVKVVRNLFSRIGDALHTSTRQRVIRNNLFFNEGDTLYPALVADNERYLRQLSYIQDARIVVKDIPGDSSAIDLVIVCKDVFPVGGSMQSATGSSIAFEANDDNLAGSGNRIQLEQLYDGDRQPHHGFGLEFLKRNIAGSFVNLAAGYQNQAPTYNSGRREEKALYIRGELPLVSPYHSWTGAFEVARHSTFNGYNNDSLYNAALKYNYRLFDGWFGHNIGARNNLHENLRSRFRKLIAIRAIHRVFDDLPDAYKDVYNIGYSNLTSVLLSYNIFEQDFYHTNFIYGFGRNEDLPEGFNISFTGGWSKRDNISRPYGGFEYRRSYFSRKQDYLNFRLSLGGYFNQGNFEDLSFLTSLDLITKLRKLGGGHWYVRHFISGSITQLARTMQNEPLRIASDFGIPRLNDPNLRASTRITLNGETVFYNTWKVLGFSFAPFGFTNISYLKSIGRYFSTGDIYTAIGGGIRTRNENLVFGTMEMKIYYYPRTTGNISPWNITFNSGLRYKYETQLIRRPDFPVLN